MLRRHMEDDEQRTDVGRKPPDERRERFDAAGGSADDNDVAIRIDKVRLFSHGSTPQRSIADGYGLLRTRRSGIGCKGGT